MYDIDTKNVRKGRNMYFITLAVGILFLIIFGGIYISSVLKKNSLDSQTRSYRVEINKYEDSDGDTMYSPTYYYRVNGNNYSCPSSTSSSNFPDTKNSVVYYDSKNPARCMNEYSVSNNRFAFIFLFIPIILIGASVFGFIKIKNRLRVIKELNKKGKLIKGLPYHLENTGTVINGVPIQRPVVEYTLSSGTDITLYGDPRNDYKLADSDGLVDLVIDENNPSNYYIDFEINRIGGNLPTDYNKQVQNNYNNEQVQTDSISQEAVQSENQDNELNNLYGNNSNQNM